MDKSACRGAACCYCSPYIVMVVSVRRMRWAGRAAGMGEMRNVYRIMVGKPERMRPNRMLRHRRNDVIKMDHKEIGWDDVD